MIIQFISAINVTADDIGLGGGTTTTIPGVIANVLTLMMSVIGGLAVIMLIVGGLFLALSGGDAGRVKKGRDIIRYAVVGIVVSIVALGLVRFIADRIG